MPPMPTRRLSPSAICLNSKSLLVIGGDAAGLQTFATVEMAERSVEGVWAWWALAPMNESRRAAGVAQLDEAYLLFAGGYQKISAEALRPPAGRFYLGKWIQQRPLHQKCVALLGVAGSILAFGELAF